MLGLTPLGAFHTAISLIALFAGFVALARHKEISTATKSGQVFVAGTVVSCLTGFGIFQHGGFGNPHILAIVTLVVLGIALLAEYAQVLGRASRYVETVSYSLALFFHFIPGTVETLTRAAGGRAVPLQSRRPEGAADHRGVLSGVPGRRDAAGASSALAACTGECPLIRDRHENDALIRRNYTFNSNASVYNGL
jgi:uncharacterized membrane protein